jgi:KUP system potassium uptake protein
LKIPQGGWFPLLIAAFLVALMTTWRRGRTALYNRFYDCAEPISKLIARLERNEFPRIAGTAVFLTGNLDRVPRAMTQNLDHNRVVHERVVLLKVVAVDEPRIDEEKRLTVTHLRGNVHCVELRYGFVEQPNVPETLMSGNCEIEFDLEQTSFFLSRETLIPSIREDLSPWREKVFIALTATASGATEFFQLPPGRVVELGSQIEI